MSDWDVALTTSEINVTLVLERTVNGEGGGGVSSWNDLTDKPTTFTPSAHTHDDRYYTETEIDALLLANAIPFRRKYNSGKVYVNAHIRGGTRNVGNGTGSFFPIDIDSAITIDALQCEITTIGVASGKAHLYLVGADPTTGLPGNTVLATSPNIATDRVASITGILSTPIAVQPGRYWGCIHNIGAAGAGTAPNFRACAPAMQEAAPVEASQSSNGLTCISKAGLGTSTTPLTTLSAGTFAAHMNQCPIIGFRVQ